MTFQKKFLADGKSTSTLVDHCSMIPGNATERKLKAIGAMAVNSKFQIRSLETC